MKMKSLTISWLAKQAGIWKPCVLRAAGTAAETAAERVRLLSFSGGGNKASATARSTDARRRVEAKIAHIDAKIRSLDSMKRTLRKLTNAREGCGLIAAVGVLVVASLWNASPRRKTSSEVTAEREQVE